MVDQAFLHRNYIGNDDERVTPVPDIWFGQVATSIKVHVDRSVRPVKIEVAKEPSYEAIIGCNFHL